MDCMRINCAHDHQDAWAAMVEHLRRAQAEHGKTCRVIMDLPGPKLRTGPIETEPGIIKWKPRRDRYGKVTELARIWLTPMEHPEPACESADACLTVAASWLAQLRSGDRIRFVDARDAWRAMEVTRPIGGSYLAKSFETSYVTSETILRVSRLRDVTRIGALPPVAPPSVLRPGDLLVLTKTVDPGKPAVRSEKGHPSRAEITDAGMAERAECVMLNKGPFVVDAVRMLDNVLHRMQNHQAKKAALLRPLSLAERFCQEQAGEYPEGASQSNRAVG
jgi:pyruvate kinase